MGQTAVDELREQGRGVVGALLVVGLSSLYTMETWWLGWRLPMAYLVGYAVIGLGVVAVLVRNVGFREAEAEQVQHDLSRLATDAAELVLQSFVAAYATLLLLGVVEVGDSVTVVVRLGLVQVVPLAFGAAVANRLLTVTGQEKEGQFPRNVATFALGAVFFTFPVAPTEEVEKIAVYAGWGRLALLVPVAVGVVYLVLYELEFRGHGSRVGGGRLVNLGTATVAYAVGAAVSIVLLLAFGHFEGATFAERVQQVIVLSTLASVGASAGEVVL